jgi:hypothetical protein
MEQTEIDEWKKAIDSMTREEMCRLWRFAPSGHPCFVRDSPVADHFEVRFRSLGGFSPEISKKIGW